jgi:hypothetical protein
LIGGNRGFKEIVVYQPVGAYPKKVVDITLSKGGLGRGSFFLFPRGTPIGRWLSIFFHYLTFFLNWKLYFSFVGE